MKNQLFFLSILCVALWSCTKENNDATTVVTVKLNPTFMTLNEGTNEPMKLKRNGFDKMKSSTTPDSVVYAIQVYENDVPYYYGLFNNVSKMQLALSTSQSYKFKVSAYKTGTGKGLKVVTDTAGVNYYLPNKTPLKNKFIKGDALKDIDLAGSIVLSGATKDYPESDAFYATKTLTIEKGMTNVDFTLLRMGFGINFTVDALTSGNMEIYVGNDTLKLNSTKPTSYTVRQFKSSTNTFANIYSNANSFGDSIAITAKWTSASGTIVTAFGKYKFLRNYQKTINIQLNSLTNNVSFESWKFPTDGLVAWYPFNGNTNDESGNGKNGTVTGATLTTDRFGVSNKAYYFNGSSKIDFTIGNIKTISISLWFKVPVQTLSFPTIFAYNSNKFSAGIQQQGVPGMTNLHNLRLYYTIQTTSSNVIVDNDVYHHLYIGLDVLNSLYSMYIDGVEVSKGKTTETPDMWTNSQILCIGKENDGPSSTFLKGIIDDVAVWNRLLTKDEILSMYNMK